MVHSVPTRLRAEVEATGFRALMALPPGLAGRFAGRPVVLDGQVLDGETQWMLCIKDLFGEIGAETVAVPQGREIIARQSRIVGGRQPVGEVRDLLVPGGAGSIGARLYTPRSRTGAVEPSPLLVFIHGGGMIYGGLDSYDPVCRFLAERADSRVLSLDYGLAPEDRFPAGVEDCWAAYQWVTENAGDLNADPAHIGVGGDSAGGYLAAVVAIKAAEAGVPCRTQLLVYPMTNMAEESESRRLFGSGFYLNDEFIGLADRSYLPPGADRRDPLLSVQFTEKFPEDLAPAHVVTAGFDPLRDEGEAYARTLAEHGVEVALKRYPGLIHSFFNVVGVGRTQRAAVAEIAAQLKAALH